jgi:outer membrane protein insertion porin family
MRRIPAIMAMSAICGFAQTKPTPKAATKATSASTKTAPAATQWPIASLVVEGNQNFTSQQVLAVAGLKIGQMAGKEEFEAARERLLATDMFETVGYKFAPGPSGGGYAGSFQVTEVSPAYPVRFEELGAPDQEIENLLRTRDPLFSKARLPATKSVLDRYTKWIQDYLASKGLDDKIAGRVTSIAPEQFVIVFRPVRNPPAVAQVTFEGNQVVPQGVLQTASATMLVGSLYTEEAFRQLLANSVKPVYEARGRLRVAFPVIRTEPAKDVNGIHVFVTIDEGQIYDLGRLTIRGNPPLSANGLLRTAELKTGDLANYDRVKEGLEKIRRALRRAGYLHCEVTDDRSIEDEKKTVDVAIRIEAGPQFLMGKLNIAGLDLDAEAEIQRIWTIKEGKPFDPEYPDYFLGRVRQDGVFDNLGQTHAETKINDQSHTADVTLTFKGAEPQAQPGRRGGRGRLN